MSATKQDSLPLTDATAIVFNSGDSTKKVRISAASVATGTTRVLTVQDLDGTIAILSQPATFTSVVTPIVDSGSTAALLAKTNNGSTQAQFVDTSSTVNFATLGGAATGVSPLIGGRGEAATGVNFFWGTGTAAFRSDDNTVTQFQVLRTASATRNITVTGSNGGNPTISTTAGALALGNGQLQFPATQNPSADVNTLDDYEEGTWVPSLGGSATYNTQTGRYTKIGRQVFVQFTLQVTAIGTGSASAVTGLPFAAASNGQILGAFWSGSGTSVVSLFGFINGTTVTTTGTTAAAAAATTQNVFTSGTIVQMSGVYDV